LKHKIRWTEHERNEVITTAVRYYNEGGYSPIAALRQAQQLMLLPYRRRTLSSHSSAPDLIKLLKQRAAQVIPQHNPVTAPAPAPSRLEAREASDMTLEKSFDGLVRTLAEKFAQVLKQEVKRVVLELDHEFKVQKHDPSYAATGVSKPRVVVIGLLNDQVHSINREFGSMFDLKFIDTDRAMGMTPPDADIYLLMKNFINHPLYHKYQVYPNHVLIDGGMTSLRTWLYKNRNEYTAQLNML
jgi:hypothetical protein